MNSMSMEYEKIQGVTRRDRGRLRCKAEIIAAASKLFAQQGISKTSMKQIADEADVSVGKLYACFRGKDEIVHEVLGESMREMRLAEDEASAGIEKPIEQLRVRLAAAVAHLKSHLDFLRILHNESPLSCEGMIREHLEEHVRAASKLLARAMEDGDIPPEDPEELGAMVVGSVHELMHSLAERGDKDALDRIPAIIDRIIIKPLETRREKDSGMEGR